jgi:pimeloyl-ACP methyl ester carboxylesterase
MRVRTSSNPWLTRPHHFGLVSIGTHSLYASVSGPIRNSHNDPLLIFFTGAGGSSALYIKLQQALSTHIRCLFYDRAGYDRSTLPPLDESQGKQILGSHTSSDLTKLLSVTGLEPPYLSVAHSFGGILLRTFLQSNPSIVTGVLLFDTATELMLSPLFPRVPPAALTSIAKNVDLEALMHLQRDSGMSDDEWEEAIQANGRCTHALSLEDTHRSAYQLSLHRQIDFQAFGDRPLTVVQCEMVADYQLLYDEGVRLGDGTEQEREEAREFIERWGALHGQIARAQTGLSREGKFVYFKEWGHDLPIRKPAIVVSEVTKLLERMGCGCASREGGAKDFGEKDTRASGTGGQVRVGKGLSPAMSFLG